MAAAYAVLHLFACGGGRGVRVLVWVCVYKALPAGVGQTMRWGGVGRSPAYLLVRHLVRMRRA